jgi:hypothetical protein
LAGDGRFHALVRISAARVKAVASLAALVSVLPATAAAGKPSREPTLLGRALLSATDYQPGPART